MIKVFLVDDHEIVRRGVADLLEEDDQIAVVGEAATVAETLEKLPPANPDLVVLDVRLPDGNGVELCRELRSLYPELHCLILTSYTDEKAMLDAILAGAGGYVAGLDPEALNGANRMRLFVFGSGDKSQARLVALLDNLGKGASGAAVQNLNLMLGLDEAAGL